MEWKSWKADTEMTLCYLFRGKGESREVLLGRKKRGFGKGLWNGLGGKIREGEDMFEAAKREVMEEAGIEVLDIEKIGELMFEIDGKRLLVHVFISERFEGEAVESEEMEPSWFRLHEIPYNEMWEDDRHWMPEVIEAVPFRFFARFENGKMGEYYFIEL